MDEDNIEELTRILCSLISTGNYCKLGSNTLDCVKLRTDLDNAVFILKQHMEENE